MRRGAIWWSASASPRQDISKICFALSSCLTSASSSSVNSSAANNEASSKNNCKLSSSDGDEDVSNFVYEEDIEDNGCNQTIEF